MNSCVVQAAAAGGPEADQKIKEASEAIARLVRPSRLRGFRPWSNEIEAAVRGDRPAPAGLGDVADRSVPSR